MITAYMGGKKYKTRLLDQNEVLFISSLNYTALSQTDGNSAIAKLPEN